MFPLYFSLITFAAGIPQGVFLGSVAARWLGLEGAWALLVIVPGGFLGIVLGYGQALLIRWLLGRR
ncbi:hypothetical protein [Prosthecobacter fluviatilis]|uniref:TVP38/TMEM64 family membrane protein n=1 Tax=Prosthecobacter fluviatilis TaxID=445931 RepID=A0ABW0KX49_9BACT